MCIYHSSVGFCDELIISNVAQFHSFDKIIARQGPGCGSGYPGRKSHQTFRGLTQKIPTFDYKKSIEFSLPDYVYFDLSKPRI